MTRPYTPFDIIWAKNVTNKETRRAYMDVEEPFILDFPTKYKGNVLSPRIGELIILHQNINISNDKAFTHLVTPIDNTLHEGSDERYRYGRRVKIIAKVEKNDDILVENTLWKGANFQGKCYGSACKLLGITGIDDYYSLLQDIWNKFIPYFKDDYKKSVFLTEALEHEIDNSDSQISVPEGKLRLITHYLRERDYRIIQMKKQQAIQGETLRCEVCGFSFIEEFGVEFIECHHKTPISQSGETETTLDDLAFVCANCHRMLHKPFEGNFLTIEGLKQRCEELKSDK